MLSYFVESLPKTPTPRTPPVQNPLPDVEIIIAAIVVSLLLLWGGVFGLLRIVDFFERKHILGLGGYASLVAALVMGLVLFTAHERQKEHQRQLREQMNDVTKRLGELSERLVGQLEEKSELTVSEFEIRARLQTEVAHHKRTQGELAETVARSDELDNVLAGERRARNAYQAEQNRKLAERFAVEEQRYKEIRDFLDVHQRLVRGLQKQVTAVQEDATTLRMTTAALETNQNGLIGKVSAARELSNLSSQKIDAIARSQAALYDDLTRTMSQVDSLYYWKKK